MPIPVSQRPVTSVKSLASGSSDVTYLLRTAPTVVTGLDWLTMDS